MVSRPSDPTVGVRAWPIILVLAIVQRVQALVTGPPGPATWIDEPINVGLDHDGPGIVPPRPAQVALNAARVREQVIGRKNRAILDRDPGVLVRGFPGLGGDDCELAWQGHSGHYVAALEYDRGIPEDEVNGARDLALPVELPEGVNVQGVLVGTDRAPVQGREVRIHAQRHCLVLSRARRVLKGNVPRQETIP